MKQKTVIFSAIIGLIFGVLFSGTLGLDFFGSNDDNDDNPQTALKKDAEGFKTAYNLSESIYLPIYGSDVQDKLDNDETFILYIGRDTCPYCQQYVPNLMEAAQNQSIDEIYHIDTVDKNNKTFVDDEKINSTPTTYLVKNGSVVAEVIGYKSTIEIEQLIIDYLI